MSYQNFVLRQEEKSLIATINRPDKMNALSIGLLAELIEIVTEFESNNELRGMVITGTGESAFAAGADIAEFADFDEQQAREMSSKGHTLFKKIQNCSKPIIAAVNGFALGGGCELAMACHFRIASENAKFGQPEVNLGVIPGYGGTQRLIDLIGKGRATELLMTGDMISSEQALAWGLVNEITKVEDLLAFCLKKLKKISQKGPLAIARIVKCVNAYSNKGLNAYELEVEEFAASFETADFKEGTKAFIEKRRPTFSGN